MRDLRLKYRLPIGSSTAYPPGYYIAETQDDLTKASYPFLKFGLKQLKMAHRLLGITRAEFIGQISIDLANELAVEEG